MFYRFQAMMEDIHTITYANLVEALVPRARQARLFKALEHIPAVQRKAAWAERYMDRDRAPLAIRLVAFAAVEGIFFSGSFCAIYWVQKQYPGKLPGLTTSNEFISRDEGLHCNFACLLFRKWPAETRPSAEEVLAILQDAVVCEKEFIRYALPEGSNIMGMNSTLMGQYIEFCADRLLVSLGFGKHYGTACPFAFMEQLSLAGKTNFFEKRVSEYAKVEMGADGGGMFDDDDDF